MDFVQKIKSNDWGIKLTPKFHPKKIEFLDIMISQEEKCFTTSTFFKSVGTNIICERFTEKGYPKPLITEAYEITKKSSQKECLGANKMNIPHPDY